MIKIVDDCVESVFFNTLKNEIFNFAHMPWFFSPFTAYRVKSTDTDDFSFSHLAVKDEEDISDLAPYARMFIKRAFEKLDYEIPIIYRVRFGLIVKSHMNKIHGPHVDHHLPHKTGLVYLNDSDGDTYFYNNYYKPELNNGLSQFEYYQKYIKEHLHIIKSVVPKSNRMVLFDGYQYHSSSSPTETQFRIVMNFNYDRNIPKHNSENSSRSY